MVLLRSALALLLATAQSPYEGVVVPLLEEDGLPSTVWIAGTRVTTTAAIRVAALIAMSHSGPTAQHALTPGLFRN